MRRDVFQALADPTRRDILLSIRKEKRPINSIAEQFSMTRQAVSLHVQYLKDCGVISITKEGRQRFCEIEPTELQKVNEWLEPFRELWEKRFAQLDHLLDEMQSKSKKNT